MKLKDIFMQAGLSDSDKVNEKIKALLRDQRSLNTNWNMGNMKLQDFIEKYSGYTRDDNGITRMLNGFNHRLQPIIAPSNKNSRGYVFFTRPQLSLTKENLIRDPIFVNLLNKNPISIQRVIRCTLDPRLAYCGTGVELNRLILNNNAKYIKEDGTAGFMASMEDEDLSCPLINNESLMAPLLTNAITNLSGFPDETLPVYKGKPNMRGGAVSFPDGIMEYNGDYTISATFLNTQDSPILLLFYFWLRYCAMVVEGRMMPYPDLMYARELDYTTRIYRLTMDQSNTYVSMIACCGAAFPNAIDIGKYFDFDISKPYADINRTININFECSGARYLSPAIVDAFNKAVCTGSPDLHYVRANYMNSDLKLPKDFTYSKIPNSLLDMFNFAGIPIINYNTLELEWWVKNDSHTFQTIKNLVARGLDKKPDDIDLTEFSQYAHEFAKEKMPDGRLPDKLNSLVKFT